MFAFIAAYNAARYAFQTYAVAAHTLNMEQSTILSQRICRKKEHAEHPDLEYVLSAGGTLTNGHLSAEFDRDYMPVDYEFVSLGRSPIVSGKTKLVIEFIARAAKAELQKPAQLELADLGDYQSGEAKHGRLWIHSEFFQVCIISWKKDGAASDAGPLDFRPIPAGRPETPRATQKITIPAGAGKLQGATVDLRSAIDAANEVIRPEVPSEIVLE